MDDVQKPSLSIDLASDIPVVQQITSGLRQALLSRALKPGDSLPSSRVLARDLGVHFNTVAQAYRTLEAEGWLTLKRRTGTVVCDRQKPELDARQSAVLTQRFWDELSDLCARYEAKGLSNRLLHQLTDRLLTPEGNQ